MAHDVRFTQQNKHVFFFGYAGGIFYQTFNCDIFDNGLSGSGEFIEVDYETCFHNVIKICKTGTALRYPDKKRFLEFKKEFINKFSNEKGKIQIQFS